MTYLLRNKPDRSKGKRFITVALGLSLFLILTLILAPGFTARTLQLMARPVWQGNNNVSASITSLLPFFRGKEDLVEENKQLNQSLQEARLRLLYLEVLERENAELKSFANRSETSHNTIAAILSRPPKTPYDVMIIDVGVNHNVQVGDLVLASGDIAIGRIFEVYDRSSRVELFSTPEVATSVSLANDGTALSARGLGNGTFELRVPRDLEVEIGDVIMVPGLDSKIIGLIESITINPTDAFKAVLVKGPINIFSLRFVSVVTHS